MNGQWIGEFHGTNTGLAVLNVDDLGDRFACRVYLLDANKNIPSISAYFETEDKSAHFVCEAQSIAPIDPRTGLSGMWSVLKELYPGSTIPESATVTGTWDENKLILEAVTSINTAISFNVTRSDPEEPSVLNAKRVDWDGFKSFVATLKGGSSIFRGQNKPYKLRTAFHRQGRCDLVRFVVQDIPALHRLLSARTSHIFNLEVPNENGAFFNLVQHHGYPTPLLDWTYSPYVAVFFAFRGISRTAARTASEEDNVRVHIFDIDSWQHDYPQLKNLVTAGLHLSIGEFMAIDNERMVAQQAVTTVTNIDDIEAYVNRKEAEAKQTYLGAVDIPVKCRDEAVKELSFMGITAGVLFPGIDGTCEDLKERFF